MEPLSLPRLAPHRNLAETVYGALKGAIIENSLPAGYRLTEAAIAASMDVSNTPVREALSRLEREGLVSLVPRRGAVVASFTAEDLLAITEVREALETHAVRKAIARRPSAVEERLAAILEECVPFVAVRDPRGFNRLDVEFHRLLVQASGNLHLQRAFEMLHDQVQVIRWQVFRIRGRPEMPHSEHEAIYAAFVAGDADEAERVLREHVRHAAVDLLNALAAKGDPQAARIAASYASSQGTYRQELRGGPPLTGKGYEPQMNAD